MVTAVAAIALLQLWLTEGHRPSIEDWAALKAALDRQLFSDDG